MEDSEETPLLEERRGSTGSTASKIAIDEEDVDSMSYDARKLVTFEVFRNFSGTVWLKSSLWKMMGILLMIAVFVGLLVAMLLKDPASLNVAKFQKVGTFLEVVVGLLLGFFLSSSVQRWYNCTNGFLELFDAVRGLHMQLNAMGVPKDRVFLCLRYCVVSAHCLDNDLIASVMTPEERAEFMKERWAKLTNDNIDMEGNYMKALGQLLPNEQVILEKLEDPAQTLWVWITSLLTRLSADGEVPPMASPTYGRIIAMAEQAYRGIRTVRASIRVQPPYVHTQMMAALVLVNNIVNAICVGMTSGVTVSICLARYRLSPFTTRTAGSEDVSHSLQDLTVALFLSTVGPFLYQALLEVSVCIAQPFASAGNDATYPGRIPTDKLLKTLVKDIRDIEFMSNNLPWWQQPVFKAK